jgi:hypothetical protein
MSSTPSSLRARRSRGERSADLWPGVRSRLRGGPDGNEQLTALTGVVLIVLLAVLGVTIVRIGQLIWLHLFLGLLLLGPVVLKMLSTGYRFVLYYVRDPVYRRRGPPASWLRMIAPIVVLTTIGVFVTGVLLIIVGPVNREPLAEIHKIFFIVWVAFMVLHVLGHLSGMPAALSPERHGRGDIPGLRSGRSGRAIVLAGAIVGGLVVAVVLIPDFAAWTAHNSAFHHHHHHG